MPATTTPSPQVATAPGLWAACPNGHADAGLWAPSDDGPDLDVSLLQATHPSIAINGIRMASPHAPWRDAQLALPGLLNHRVVHLYGCALGHLPTLLLSSSECVEDIHVHILNSKAFKIQLEHMPDTEWLADPRVKLRMALASDKPEQDAAMHISVPDVQLIEPGLWRLRDRLQAQLNRAFVDKRFPAAPTLWVLAPAWSTASRSCAVWPMDRKRPG